MIGCSTDPIRKTTIKWSKFEFKESRNQFFPKIELIKCHDQEQRLNAFADAGMAVTLRIQVFNFNARKA